MTLDFLRFSHYYYFFPPKMQIFAKMFVILKKIIYLCIEML